jgi:protein arginine kinase activator
MEDNLKENTPPLVCSCCGIHYSDFEKTGMLGCAGCYLSFEKKLEELLRRIHGSHKHIGSRPITLRVNVAAANLAELQKRLQNAISCQNYEAAAKIRDVIKDIQRQQH